MLWKSAILKAPENSGCERRWNIFLAMPQGPERRCAMWIELINTTFLSTSGSIGCTILQVGHFSSSHTMHDLFWPCSGCSELLSAKFPLVSICSSHLQHCLAHFCRPQNSSKFCFFSSAKVLREFRETFAEEFCVWWAFRVAYSLYFCYAISIALENNSLIDVLCNRKYCLYVKLIFSVFIFPLTISTIQIKSWQSHEINEILSRNSCKTFAKEK